MPATTLKTEQERGRSIKMPPRRLPQGGAKKCADPFAGAESLQVFGGEEESEAGRC